jgi:hypothetical protein
MKLSLVTHVFMYLEKNCQKFVVGKSNRQYGALVKKCYLINALGDTDGDNVRKYRNLLS